MSIPNEDLMNWPTGINYLLKDHTVSQPDFSTVLGVTPKSGYVVTTTDHTWYMNPNNAPLIAGQYPRANAYGSSHEAVNFLQTQIQRRISDLDVEIRDKGGKAARETYHWILNRGATLEAPKDLVTPRYRIRGIQARVWLSLRVVEGNLRLYTWSDTFFVAGIMSLIRLIYDDLPPDEIHADFMGKAFFSGLLALGPSTQETTKELTGIITAIQRGAKILGTSDLDKALQKANSWSPYHVSA